MLLGAAVEGIGIPVSELVSHWRKVPSLERSVWRVPELISDLWYQNTHFPYIPSIFSARECVILEAVPSAWFGGSVAEFPYD